MKKRLGVIILVIIMVTLTACSGAAGPAKTTEPEAIEKDVSMLLKGIGDSIEMVKSLGALPKAQVNGNLHFFQNTDVEGYFSGFDLGVETEEDGDTVKQIYIQPIANAKITANSLVVGGDVADAKAVFGQGELSSVENKGKIINFITFQDQTYVMKTTVDEQRITAVAFTQAQSPAGQTGKPDQEAVGENQPEDPKDSEDTDASGTLAVKQPGETEDQVLVNPEQAFAFDGLLEFLGRDYMQAEEFLGDEYSWDRDLYGGSAIFEGELIKTTLGENLDTGLATMIMIEYSNPQEDNEPIGMGGFLLGSQAKGDSLSGIPYGDYTLFVYRNEDNRISGIQAIRTNPIPVAAVEPYKLSIEQFDTYSILSLTYDGTGEKVELVNTDGRTDGDQFFDGMDVKILAAKASGDGRFVYFETDDPKMTSGYGAANNTILKYDIGGGDEENICMGFLYDTVMTEGYEDCIIISYYEPDPRGGYYEPYILIDGEGNYHFMGRALEADLADQVRRAYNGEIDEYAMDTPDNETIYGQYVDYSKYSAVVVEDYEGINKDKFINNWTLRNPYYEEKGETLYPNVLALFGTIYNVRWEVGIGWGESETYFIADQWSDAYITYESWRPGDSSTDTFLFEDAKGREYAVMIEDCSDNIDLVLVP